jgi:aspartyl-tRNA(Asn)/glutamyl-tRNA(Gln) amidotransferase subunit C
MSDKKSFDVSKIAALARLEITDQEKKYLEKDLDKIIGYIDMMSELDVENIQPTAHAVPLTNVIRDDVKMQSFDKELMLSNAPELVDDELIKVHQVVDSH